MNKTTFYSLIAALSLLFLSTSAISAPREGDFFFSPMIGGHIFEGNLDPFDINDELDHGITFGLGLGYYLQDQLGTEIFINATDTKTDPSDINAEVFPIRLDVFYDLMNKKDLIPYLAGGLGAEKFRSSDLDNDTDFMVNYGGGVKYFFKDDMALRADVRHLISFDDTHSQLLYTVGLVVTFGGDKGKTATPAEKAKSQPAPTPAPAGMDTDKDGVPDSIDECPETVTGAPVNAKGCPMDSDNDGVADDRDGCPDTPQGVAVDNYGCPETNAVAKEDSDSDGVSDDKDDCEGTPDGATVDARGCWVIKNLKFESGKADIVGSSYAGLNEVVAVLKANPGLKLEIQGYTDNRGSAEFNRILSDKRANAVKDYIVSKGVDEIRLTAKGYGIENPIASNETAEGRAQNRRVELNPLY